MQRSQLSSLSIETQTQTDATPRRTFSLRDAIPFAVTVAAGLFCYGLFVDRSAWLSVIGYSVAPAERVMNGEIPYRDFLYNYTPGMLWLNASLMKAFGVSLLTVNYGLYAFKMLSLVTLFVLSKRLTSSWIALAPVALTLSWLGHKYIFGVVPTQYSLVFVLVGLLFMLNYDRTEKRSWLFASGIAIGVVFLFKYNVGILLLGTGTALILLRDTIGLSGNPLPRKLVESVKRASVYWTGFALVMLALVAYMALNNALGAMVDHFLHHAAAYSEARAVPLPSIKLIGPAVLALLIAAAGAVILSRKAPRLLESYLIAVLITGSLVILIPGRLQLMKASGTALVAYLPVFLFIGVAVFLLWLFRWKAKSDDERRRQWKLFGPIIIVMLFALGAFLEMYPRADYYHLVRILPPIFLLLLLVIIRGGERLGEVFEGRLRAPRRAAILCGLIPLIFLSLVGVKDTWKPQFDSSFHMLDREPLEIERAEGIKVTPRQKEFIEEMTRAIEANSAPGDQIFSFAQRGTGFYFLADRRNPTRFVWWRTVGIKSDARESVLKMIADREPKLVLVQDSLTDPRVRDTVDANYHEVAAVADIAIYDRNE
ncbi:MAG TPA: glycosyltransferase family 39 protein [Blastocatellia bacterium]|nr:glycosyltransferase family 39 protein [Blastocatellia bacterium]